MPCYCAEGWICEHTRTSRGRTMIAPGQGCSARIPSARWDRLKRAELDALREPPSEPNERPHHNSAGSKSGCVGRLAGHAESRPPCRPQTRILEWPPRTVAGPLPHDEAERRSHLHRCVRSVGHIRVAGNCDLIIGGHRMQMTSVVQSDREMHATVETWKAAMLDKGWT